MSEALENIRKKIDALDDQIHDLLMRRADLIVDILDEKKRSGLPIVQPAREAMMIRRLLARHRGPLPDGAIVGIWRELVGAVSLLQTGLKVVVAQGPGLESRWDAAKAYFGTVLPMSQQVNALSAIADMRDNKASFAVVPWPADGEVNAWWPFLAAQDDKNPMRITVALPYGAEKDFEKIIEKSLVISRGEYAESGADHSFVVLSLAEPASRARIRDAFKSQGFAATTLYNDKTLHLVEIQGFVANNDRRLRALEKMFEPIAGRCTVMGGYPQPPVYRSFKLPGRKSRKAA
ncbi:MAG: chorismate mutase [Alphaproteobacteria bacterium]|nr:chorismate mutase [Alphaproteobacteria bacterium]